MRIGESRFVVVVGVDGSPASSAALETACGLARGGVSAVVHAVRAVRPEAAAFDAESGLNVSAAPDLFEERRALDALCVEHALWSDTSIVRHVVVDRPVDAILALARRCSADLVVIGTRRRRGLERLLLGSLRDSIVQASPCPVLVVPQRTEEHRRSDVRTETQLRHAM